MKRIFYWLLAIWIGGYLLGRAAGSAALSQISANIFGSGALLLGAFLLLRWGMKKMGTWQSEPSATPPPHVGPRQLERAEAEEEFVAQWSKWSDDGGVLTADYTVSGPGMPEPQQIRIRVSIEPGISGVLRIPNIIMMPGLDTAKAEGKVVLISPEAGTATSELRVRLGKASWSGREGEATLVNFVDRPGADEFVSVLMGGEDFELAVWDSKEQLAAIPLANDGGFRRLYSARVETLRTA